MLVRTFQAEDMQSALQMIKAEFGVDALVLNSKKNRRKGIMGIFSKPFVEVTAALAPKPVPMPVALQSAEEEKISTRDAFQNSMLGPIARELKELREQVEKLSRTADDGREANCSQSEKWRGEVDLLPAADKSQMIDIGGDRVEKFKKLLMDTIASREKQDQPPIPRPSAIAADLVIKDISTEYAVLNEIGGELGAAGIAEEFIDILKGSLRPLAEQGLDRMVINAKLAEVLSGMIKCKAPLQKKRTGPRIMALVGPAGAGKTTAAVKLAARFARSKGADVVLVTDDKCGSGAFEGLRSLSKLGGVPLLVLDDLQEIGKTISKHSDKDLILIDTAGRSHKNPEKMQELKALTESPFTVEIHLCVSSTTRDRELRNIIAQYSCLPIGGLIFTRMDESETFGSVVNAHLESKIPISYFNKEEQLSGMIEVATGRKLADLVLRKKEMSCENSKMVAL